MPYGVLLQQALEAGGSHLPNRDSHEWHGRAFHGRYGDFAPIGSARVCRRGLVSKACSLGRRFIARGSTRPGRLPTICSAILAKAALISCAAGDGARFMTNRFVLTPARTPRSIPPPGPTEHGRPRATALPTSRNATLFTAQKHRHYHSGTVPGYSRVIRWPYRPRCRGTVIRREM